MSTWSNTTKSSASIYSNQTKSTSTYTDIEKRAGQESNIYNNIYDYNEPMIYNGKLVEVWTNQTKN